MSKDTNASATNPSDPDYRFLSGRMNELTNNFYQDRSFYEWVHAAPGPGSAAAAPSEHPQRQQSAPDAQYLSGRMSGLVNGFYQDPEFFQWARPGSNAAGSSAVPNSSDASVTKLLL